MPGRVLVTGISSFTGPYIARELSQAGFDLLGLTQADCAQIDNVRIEKVNLLDLQGLSKIMAEFRPSHVIHLAAITFVPHGDAEEIYLTNIVGTRNLLRSLDESGSPVERVLLASSANVYGNSTEGCLDENTAFAPANDYAASKVAMEYMANIWLDKLPIAFVRPFNYTGVGQTGKFLIPKIISHFADRSSVIELGNTEVIRDFSDVRFVVSAYRELLNSAKLGEAYNLCSGKGKSLGEIIHTMNALAGYEIEVRVNPDFVRANEIRQLIGDNGKLIQVCPDLEVAPFEQTLQWMYNSASA